MKFVWEDVIAVKQNVKRQSNSLGLFVKELSGWGEPHQWRRNFGCNAKYQLANFAEAAAVADSCHLSRILSLKRGQIKYYRPNTLMKGSKCKLSMLGMFVALDFNVPFSGVFVNPTSSIYKSEIREICECCTTHISLIIVVLLSRYCT